VAAVEREIERSDRALRGNILGRPLLVSPNLARQAAALGAIAHPRADARRASASATYVQLDFRRE
jgi:hypothetical protein